jgi:tellurite resistance protein
MKQALPLSLPHGGLLVRDLPVSLFSAVMGLAGLALAWRAAAVPLHAPPLVGEAIGALAVVVFVLVALAYLAKLARHPQVVRAEFGHAVAGNFFGTIVISLLLLSVVIAPYGGGAARVLWTLGVVASLSLSFVVVSRLLKGAVDRSLAVPAWFIPCVGTLNIPVTGAHMPMPWVAEINLLAGAVGSVMALVLFAMIVSRLVHGDPLVPAMAPSLMILVAPFAVGFLAYSNIVGTVDRFGALLFYFGLFMFAVVAAKVFRPGATFFLGWWSIGFPMAALVNAALRYAQFRDSGPLWVLAAVLLSAVSMAMAMLTVRTVQGVFSGRLFA